MAVIEMSPVFVLGFVSRICGPNGGASSEADSVLFSNVDIGGLIIMKGTIPTDISTIITMNKTTDKLLNFTPSNVYPISSLNTNPAIIQSNYVAATATGIATWFLINIVKGGSVTVNGIIGTVGLIGSGADLEIPDTNIVTGTPYRITNLQLRFPTSFTY